MLAFLAVVSSETEVTVVSIALETGGSESVGSEVIGILVNTFLGVLLSTDVGLFARATEFSGAKLASGSIGHNSEGVFEADAFHAKARVFVAAGAGQLVTSDHLFVIHVLIVGDAEHHQQSQ